MTTNTTPSPDMEAKLKPCPFCGPRMVEPDLWNSPDGSTRWQVNCGGCGASAGNCASREKAIAAWNTRAQADTPDDVANQVAQMGRVEWGAVKAKSDSEHVSDFADSLAITRQNYGMEGNQSLHGLYLEGTETVLCHTGTSPNSAKNARALAALWNRSLSQSGEHRSKDND